MKDMLAKKFKREKESEKRAKDIREVDVYKNEMRAEKAGNNVERKKRADE